MSDIEIDLEKMDREFSLEMVVAQVKNCLPLSRAFVMAAYYKDSDSETERLMLSAQGNLASTTALAVEIMFSGIKKAKMPIADAKQYLFATFLAAMKDLNKAGGN